MKHIIHNQLYIYNFICLISCRLKISFCPILWKKGRKKFFLVFQKEQIKGRRKSSCFLKEQIEGIDQFTLRSKTENLQSFTIDNSNNFNHRFVSSYDRIYLCNFGQVCHCKVLNHTCLSSSSSKQSMNSIICTKLPIDLRGRK